MTKCPECEFEMKCLWTTDLFEKERVLSIYQCPKCKSVEVLDELYVEEFDE